MSNKITYFLIALAATNLVQAQECPDDNNMLESDKGIEQAGINVRTQNLIRSLIRRRALFYHEGKKTIGIDLTKLSNHELNMYIKSQETDVDLRKAEVSLKPEFSNFIIKQQMMRVNELRIENRALSEDEIMENLLENMSPDLRNDLAASRDHSFA